MGVKYETTKLTKTVKAKLKQRQGSLGISEFIEQMMTFFDVTGAKPSDFQTHPTVQLKKDIDRGIAVTRGVEVNVLKKMEAMAAMLQAMTEQRDGRTIANTSPATAEEEGAITGEMIQQVVTENERLTERLNQVKEREKQLQAEVDKLKSTLPLSENGNGGNREALELFGWLNQNMKKNTFNEDFSISAVGWRGFQERFKTLK